MNRLFCCDLELAFIFSIFYQLIIQYLLCLTLLYLPHKYNYGVVKILFKYQKNFAGEFFFMLVASFNGLYCILHITCSRLTSIIYEHTTDYIFSLHAISCSGDDHLIKFARTVNGQFFHFLFHTRYISHVLRGFYSQSKSTGQIMALVNMVHGRVVSLLGYHRGEPRFKFSPRPQGPLHSFVFPSAGLHKCLRAEGCIHQYSKLSILHIQLSIRL